MPCLKNIQIRSQKQLMSQHIFWLNPTSVEGSKTFINELRSSATGSQALPDRVSTPAAVARTRSSSLPIPYKARLSHSLPCETAPRRSSSNLAADASSTCGIRHTATTKPPSSYIFFPLLMHINEIITHRSTTSQTNMGMITMQFSRSHGQPLQRPQEMQQMLKIFVCRSLVFHKHDAMSDKHANPVTKTIHVKTHFWLNPTSVAGSKTFINELRSSATGSQALPDRVSTPPAAARTRSSSFRISYKARLSHSLPCETAPRRSSSNLAADASSTYSIRHTATTKQKSSHNIPPCDKHAAFVTILVCPTGPALEVPRHPAIERAALQPQTTSCPVHGQHSEPVPCCEAPLRKFGPGHPGAIRDPWSQHCYAAPATEVPRHRTTRMTRSHAPFAQTFPSANETATTERPQTSPARDFKQTFCIEKFRDTHLCSLAFKTMP